ncbi:death-associated protein kinase 1-like isoform X3 [Haemaphysalis longicornis]
MFTGRDSDWVGLDDAAAPTVDSRGVSTWRENITAAMCAMPLPSYPFSFQDENFVVAALFCAVEEGNLAGLEELFSMSHINPNQSNKHGETAVHIAAGLAQLQILKLLHSKGANLKLSDSHGDSAMYWAARQGHTDVIQYLWENGVSVDCQNKSGETALHVAARYGHHSAVKLLCSFGANINVTDEHGDTALHIAAWHGFPAIMHVLCEAGAHTHLRNKEGETPVHTASARGHLESVRCLLEAGADPDLLDKHGCTALHLALRRHHISVALLLLHNGCQTDVVDNHGETAIHVAARDGLLSLAQTLCAFGCKVDVPNKAGLYPLHLAAKNGHTEVVRCLCLAGCNVDQKNRDGIPAEITALAQGHSPIGDLLNRLRNEQLKEEYIAQMIPGTQPLSRIKLKVFGHSGVGKTTLLESLKCGYFSSWFRRSKTSPTSPKPKPTSGPHSSRSSTPAMDEYTIDTDSENNIRTVDLNDMAELSEYKKSTTPPALLISSCMDMDGSQPLFSETTNPNYTRGIDVQQATVSGVGDLSVWEFSGHEPYLMLYDHFVGNAHCLHLVVFSLADPVQVQIRQVCFWLAYLQARAPPVEPLGMGGKSASPLRVALVATHADVCANNTFRNQNFDLQQQQSNAEGDSRIVLAAARERFQHVFDLHENVFVMDAQVVGSQSMKFLKQYLSNNRNKIIQGLPKSTGFLESMVGHLPNWRKSSPSFPVLSWRQFMDMVHIQVNPLAGEEHMRELIHQLQLMGEVLYTKSEAEDMVVLNPKWLCSSVIGELLSQEHLEKARVTGCYTVEDFQFAYTDADAIDLLQVLENLKMCTKCDNDGDVEYEFPCYNLVETLEGLWDPSDPRYAQGVYCGVHVLPFDDFPHILATIFTRIQVQLRRASMEHADSDSDLYQWLRGSKFCSGALEGMLTLVDNDSALEVKVRGPRGSSSSCFYFLEDLLMVVDDVLGEVCPGAQFERHLLSAADLRHHALSPARYPARLVMRAMLRDGAGLHAQVLHPQTGMPESACDLLCCRDVASVASLVCGPDTHASQLSLLTRQRLGAALDPPEKLGRDWCLLAVQLGMTERLPELDPESKESGALATSGKSPIARVLGEWTLVMDSTIGHLARALDELGREDAADIVLGTSPLVKVAVAAVATSPASPTSPRPGRHEDARVAAAVSAASSSNISR